MELMKLQASIFLIWITIGVDDNDNVFIAAYGVGIW
jgi:hypothetical protein